MTESRFQPTKSWGYEKWKCPRCKAIRHLPIGTPEVLCACVKTGQRAAAMEFVKRVIREREITRV